MGSLERKVRKVSSPYPYSVVVRNYLGSCDLYETRTTEYNSGTECHISITMYGKGRRQEGPLFSVSDSGTKKTAYEKCYRKLVAWLDLMSEELVTQGDDLVPDEVNVSDKKENVIIEGAEQTVKESVGEVSERNLSEWSSTEGYYDFQAGNGSVMNRWFPMDSVEISTSNLPESSGGLLKSWTLPQDLINVNFDAINILPMRGFVLGKYAMEFKLVVQANPFQACCIMLSVAPYSYGMIPKYHSVSGIRQYDAQVRVDNMYCDFGRQFTYFDYQAAVQRRHIIMDVTTGGEATLTYRQCFPRTLVRNFDFSQNSDINPGIRGSNVGSLSLHVLSRLRVGAGNMNSFNARIFYRFVEAKMTAMTQTISRSAGTVLTGVAIPKMRATEYVPKIKDAIKRDLAAKTTVYTEQIKKEIASLETQGPVMSVLGGVKVATDVVQETVGMIERVGEASRRGFGSRNRDKPNDVIGVVKVVPRPRQGFLNGEAIDDAVLFGVSHVEKTEFYENFADDPTTFGELLMRKSYFGRFLWTLNHKAGTSIFKWNLHPTHNPYATFDRLDGNELRNLVSIFSSGFTYYCGTMVLTFQIVKTQYHKGSLEISTSFGKNVHSAFLSSGYVKVVNVQDATQFDITVPYIYDTPMRLLAGTATPGSIPPLSSEEVYSLANTANIQVKVLNELVAPTSVQNEVEVLVWIRAGDDFSLAFPHAVNSVTVPLRLVDVCQNPFQVRKYMQTNQRQKQYQYDLVSGSIVEIPTVTGFVVQSDDFKQGPYSGNRITSVDHMRFKSLMKMPIKILSNFEFEATRQMRVRDSLSGVDETYSVQNYVFLPVTCLNNTLLLWLENQVYSGVSIGCLPLFQSVQAQIASMFSMYRGSVSFTVVLKQGDVMYAQYLPHDYKLRSIQASINETYQVAKFEDSARLTGIPAFQLGANGKKEIDLAGSGCYTTFVCKAVNPSEKFEIPMGTQTNWLTLNRRLASGDKNGIYTMRENSEWFNGHLAMWTTSGKCSVDVYMNCGDDFELAGFMGHVGICNPYSAYALNDNWRTQGLDFPIKDLTQIGWKSIRNWCVNLGGASLFGALTVVGPQRTIPVLGALTLYCAVGGVTQIVELRNAITRGQKTLEEVGSQVGEILETGSNMLFDVIATHFPWLASSRSIKDSLWNIGQNVIHAVVSRNWINCSFAAFNILLETRLFVAEDWAALKDGFEQFFSRYVGNNFVTQGLDEAWTAMMEVIVTLITVKLQIRNSGGISWYLMEIFKWQNYNNVRGLSSVLGLLRMFLKSVSRIIEWAFQEADPNISLIKALSAQDEQLGDFLEQSNVYLNTFNDADFKRKDMRIRFLHVILRAFKLRLVLLRISNPKLTAQLLNVCNKVIDKAQKQRYLFKCDLVKMEPYVLCIEGASGIGKSFSVYNLCTELFDAIGLKSQNPDIVFTIPAGVQYWNGYGDQPMVWYDDWCNLADEETMRLHISQLYALKTSAPFNVPRAELENKEQTAAPLAVIMTTNVPFPESSIFADKRAVYRRRDALVRFELKEGVVMEDVSAEELKDFAHLQVRFYEDVTKPGSLGSRVYSYSEFVEELKSRFRDFYNRELRNKQNKYDILMKSVRSMKVDSLNLGNPFDLIDRVVVENEALLTSELLDEEVQRLLQLIRNQVELAESNVADEEMFVPQGLLGDVKRLFVHRCSNFKKKFMEWLRVVRQKLFVCENCLDVAQKHGTAFWCNEGSHYMCFHCGVCAGSVRVPPNDLDVNATGTWITKFLCPMHNSTMEIKNADFLTAFIAEVIFNKIDTPFKWYSFLKGMMGGAPLPNKFMYGLVMMVQYYVYFITSILKRKSAEVFFSVQGWANTVEMDDFMVCSNAYKREAMVESIDYREQFNRLDPSARRGSIYVCMHSMLVCDYIYEGGKFTILEEDLEIPDEWCKGRCCLSNVKYLNAVKLNLQVSLEYVELYKARRIETIKTYFPRFLWPGDLEVQQTRLDDLRRVLSRSWWENYVSTTSRVLNKYLKFVVPLLGACVGLWTASRVGQLIWDVIKRFFGVHLETEAKHGEYREKKKRKTGRPSPRTAFSTQATSQNFENKLDKIAGNCIVLSVGRARIIAWGVKGSTFLLPKHMLGKIYKEKFIEIVFVLKKHERIRVHVEHLEIVTFERRDLAMVTVKGVRVLFRDCSHFVPQRAEQEITYSKATMLEVDMEEMEIYNFEVEVMSLVKGTTAKSPDGSDFGTDLGIMYAYEKPGLCGSLLCVDGEFPIVSMHVSGSAAIGKGIGALIERVDFNIQGVPIVEDAGENSFYYGEDTHFAYEATVPRDLVPFVPNKTTIVPSLLDASFEKASLMRPAYMGSEPDYPHAFSPVFYGVQKNGRPPFGFPVRIMDAAFELVSRRLVAGKRCRHPRVLTVQEAIMGIRGVDVEDKYGDKMDPYYGAMELSTSAGWPYTTERYKKKFSIGSNSKKAWIDVKYGADGLPVSCGVHARVMQDLQEAMEWRKKGIPAINVFQDCVKDEKRMVQKAESVGGTRLFSMSNVQGTIALRQYTLDLVEHLRLNRVANGFCVGINPDSMEWTILAQTLKAKGLNFFTTDFTNFGASLDYGVASYFSGLMNKFYEYQGEDSRVARALCEELLASRHIVGNLVYRVFCGSPSGAAITVEINSFVHTMYIVIVWMIIARVWVKIKCKAPGYSRELDLEYVELEAYLSDLDCAIETMDLEDFKTNVGMAVYGDDGLFSVSDEYKEVFNAYTINLVLKEHGIGVTDATKSATILKYGRLEQMTFLKRSFVPNELMPHLLYTAQMDWTVVEECVRWVRQKPYTPEVAVRENCISSLLLAWGHGERKYNEWRTFLNERLELIGIDGIDLLWEDIATMYFPDIGFE